jgi:hypothetical protein
LPSAGWAPELLPSKGLFPTGGTPPNQWRLVVRVPDGFLVHTSGRSSKTSRKGRDITVLAVQRPEDRYPFVVAGRYKETRLDVGAEKVFLWTRAHNPGLRLGLWQPQAQCPAFLARGMSRALRLLYPNGIFLFQSLGFAR